MDTCALSDQGKRKTMLNLTNNLTIKYINKLVILIIIN